MPSDRVTSDQVTSDHVLSERDNGVLTITLNRPNSLNALNLAMHQELDRIFSEYANDDNLFVAIITGAGDKAFCAGSDLKQQAPLDRHQMPASGYAGLIERFDLVKPVIAAVNGHAIGGGMEIVLACDLAISVSTAQFGLPEPRVGLAATGGLHRLSRQLPMKHAMKIALTGALFDAQQACELALINEVVEPDQLDTAIDSLVNSLRECSPMALRATKQMILQGINVDGIEAAFAQHYDEYESMHRSQDAIEGMTAFSEKRKPVWSGR